MKNINKQFVEKITPTFFKNIRILSFTHIKRYINKQRSLRELLGKREILSAVRIKWAEN